MNKPLMAGDRVLVFPVPGSINRPIRKGVITATSEMSPFVRVEFEHGEELQLKKLVMEA